MDRFQMYFIYLFHVELQSNTIQPKSKGSVQGVFDFFDIVFFLYVSFK